MQKSINCIKKSIRKINVEKQAQMILLLITGILIGITSVFGSPIGACYNKSKIGFEFLNRFGNSIRPAFSLHTKIFFKSIYISKLINSIPPFELIESSSLQREFVLSSTNNLHNINWHQSNMIDTLAADRLNKNFKR